MNSSVKSFVPRVSDPFDDELVVEDVLLAAELEELELLLLPHAATSTAARIVSTPAARVRANRRDSRARARLGDAPDMLLPPRWLTTSASVSGRFDDCVCSGLPGA